MRATAILDMLLPPLCSCCDAQVSAPGLLCTGCFQTLNVIADPVCERCGLPFANEIHAGSFGICAACLDYPPAWNKARAALLYNDGAKRLILPLKHSDRPENATVLARFMHRAGAALLARAELIVPVPLHRWRLLSRRYNQSVLLAQALGKLANLPMLPDALHRTRATVRLGEHSAAVRRSKLHGAIAAHPVRGGALLGRRILLIDDVLTSGATANACAHALLDAGAANVDVLAAARVCHPGRNTPATGHDDEDH